MLEWIKQFLTEHSHHIVIEYIELILAISIGIVIIYFVIKYLQFEFKKEKKEKYDQIQSDKKWIRSLSFKKKENKEKIQ